MEKCAERLTAGHGHRRYLGKDHQKVRQHSSASTRGLAELVNSRISSRACAVSLEWRFIADPGVIAALAAGLQLTVVLCLCSAIGSLLVGLTISTMRIAGPKPLQRAANLYVL